MSDEESNDIKISRIEAQVQLRQIKFPINDTNNFTVFADKMDVKNIVTAQLSAFLLLFNWLIACYLLFNISFQNRTS